MKSYPKNVLSTADLLQKLVQNGMMIADASAAESKLNEIGFYRLRGCFFTYMFLLQKNTFLEVPLNRF